MQSLEHFHFLFNLLHAGVLEIAILKIAFVVCNFFALLHGYQSKV